MVEFPLLSLKVHVIVVDPPSTKLNVSDVVPFTVPAQLSVVDGTESVPSQSTVTADSVGVTGAVISSTTMFCVCVDVFPLPSSKVQVTVVEPCVELVNESVVVPVIVPPQLSDAVGALPVMVAEHSPVASGSVIESGIGAKLSTTVTVAVSEADPLSSVTVRVTVFAPISAHVKDVISVSKANVPVPVLPLLTASSAIVALPVASKFTDMFCVTTVGPVGAASEVRLI